MDNSGFHHVMRFRLISKLERAGAISEVKAVTMKEAGLDIQEQLWLRYLAGGFLSRIKKTENGRYHV